MSLEQERIDAVADAMDAVHTCNADASFPDLAKAAISVADATRPVTDAMRRSLQAAMESEPYAAYDFTWCSKSERDELLTLLCEAVLKVTQ